MTRMAHAKIAGFTFLFYIAAGIANMIFYGRAVAGDGITAKLAHIAEHAADVHIAVLLTLLCAFSAVVLAVTLYAVTRDVDHDLAVMVLACRGAEAVLIATGLTEMVRLLGLATAGAGSGVPDAATASVLGSLFLMPDASSAAIFFALGSTVFSYLLVRGRLVPSPLAWLGVFASALLLVALPLQLVGILKGAFAWYVWMPALAFEVPLGLWLLLKGINMSPTAVAAPSA